MLSTFLSVTRLPPAQRSVALRPRLTTGLPFRGGCILHAVRARFKQSGPRERRPELPGTSSPCRGRAGPNPQGRKGRDNRGENRWEALRSRHPARRRTLLPRALYAYGEALSPQPLLIELLVELADFLFGPLPLCDISDNSEHEAGLAVV